MKTLNKRNKYHIDRNIIKEIVCVKHKDTWYIKAGCFWGTIAELKDKVLSTHKSMVYLANISILEQL